jgi:xylulokinase
MTNETMNVTPERYLIGLDLGTTGLKGVLITRDGQVLSSAEAETRFNQPRDGWFEVEPENFFQNVAGVIEKLAAAAGTGQVAALAIAGATGNTLLTTADGKPLTPIINWMDRRGEQEPLNCLNGLTSAEVTAITGWPCLETFPLAHLAWLRQNRSELWHPTTHVGMDSDWLLHRLTGVWRMDYSTASTFHLQNQAARQWHGPFLRRLDISPDQLSPLCPAATPVGRLGATVAARLGLTSQTLVVSGCFDHPAAARAVGVIEPGQLLLSCGTSWVGFIPHEDREQIIAAGLLCDPFLAGSDPHGGNGQTDNRPWGGIFSVPYIGRAIDWYASKLVAPGEDNPWPLFNRLAEQSPTRADGLKIDLRQPPTAAIDAAPSRIARAVMENAAHLLAEKLDALRHHGFRHTQAVMVGGPSESKLWRQILAETTGLELTGGGRAAGARGAAMLAGIGAGWYKNETEALKIWEKRQ